MGGWNARRQSIVRLAGGVQVVVVGLPPVTRDELQMCHAIKQGHAALRAPALDQAPPPVSHSKPLLGTYRAKDKAKDVL